MEISCTKSWDIPDEVMHGIAADLITAAIEGGINYWGAVSEYRWGCPSLGHSDDRPWTEGELPYAVATVHDVEDRDFPPTEVDAPKVIEALKKILCGQIKPFYTLGYGASTYAMRLTKHLDDIVAGAKPDETEYDYDASDAEMVIQVALFGEVVYG